MMVFYTVDELQERLFVPPPNIFALVNDPNLYWAKLNN